MLTSVRNTGKNARKKPGERRPRRRTIVPVAVIAACLAGSAGTAAAAPHPPLARTTKATQALQQARRTGHSVPVSLTPTSATVANPQGNFTLTQSAAPVRAWQGGAWKNLDPRLHVNQDHTVSPNLTTSGLRLSGGGAGALATMSAAGRTLALTWPTPLPAPAVAGATATYRSVLKGVDLVVTVSPQGGFSDTLIVRPAADPRLAGLTMATRGTGLSVTADEAGNLKAAATAHGAPVFTADAPVRADHSIPLVPDRRLLTKASTAYVTSTWLPQYAYSARDAWAQVDTAKKNAAHWMPAELQSGFCGQGCDHALTARSFVRMSVPAQLQGAQIMSSELGLTVASAPYASCSGAPAPGVQLWSTGAISPATTWNHEPAWHENLGTQTPPACAGQTVRFPLTAFMRSHAQGATSLTLGIRAASETDQDGWKQFHASALSLSTTYDNAPALPSDPATSPGGPCQTGSPSATMIGRDDITFQTVATDPDGGQLSTEFVVKDYDGGVVYDTGDPATSGVVSTSGTPVRLVLRRDQIERWHADGATAAHAYSWYTRTSDGELYSPATGTGSAGSPCTFTYDPTQPPAPGVAIAADAGALGQSTTLTLAPCAGALQTPPATCTGTAPSRYTYQVDSGKPQSVAATGGAQTVQLPLHHVGPNTVSVIAFTAAGNPGESASADFSVTRPATPYADGDIDGDGHADLLFAGTDADPGLWLARGDGAGHLGAPADIGAAGTGTGTAGSSADWTGAQVLHGDFTGDHVQDVLAYFPGSGVSSVVFGNGDALPLDPSSGQETLFSDRFTDYTLNDEGDNPAQLVAAGNASLTGTGIADLIGITGDTDNGYQLDLYTTCGDCAATRYGYTQTLAGPADSPDGAGDWHDFSLTTAQPDGKTVLFALKKSTGELWESTNPSQDAATLIGTPGTWTKIDVPWTATSVPTLVSGDVNAAGAVELWALAGRDATPYTLTGTTLRQET